MTTIGWLRSCCVVSLFWLVTNLPSIGQSFTKLVDFNGKNGNLPESSFVQGLDGNLYGTTYFGGAHGQGTVYKISAAGKLTTVFSFCALAKCADGMHPEAGLVVANDGNYYGTTFAGGANNAGTVFRVTPAGKQTLLYSFCAAAKCVDGSSPMAGLVQATNGSFYGTTFAGGVHGFGTIFKITANGVFTTLHNFCNANKCNDGANPTSGLMQAVDGNFYGTAGFGAFHNGIVFKMTPAGVYTTLHSFTVAEGLGPDTAGLIQSSDGDFYGSKTLGGMHDNGTVYKVTPSGLVTVLYSFCALANCADGAVPAAPLMQATDGNFYGTTQHGGTANGGTIFVVTPTGELTTLYTFCSVTSCKDGETPYATLAQNTDGNFYGTTGFGGNSTEGVVFLLSTGLGPFVETLPNFGKAGGTVKILGTNLKGTTNVSFNGAVTTFSVVSKSEIVATVPAGATTGEVQVTGPSGLLSSNGVFRVGQ